MNPYTTQRQEVIILKKNNLNKTITSFILTAAFIISSITVPSSVSHSAVRTKSITLNTSNLVLQEGEKAEIKVTKVKPKKAKKKVTYKSNKKTVATVTKKGVVTAKKEGTAKITVTSKTNKKVKKTVKVTVVKKTGDNMQNNPDVSIQTPAPGKKPAQTPAAKATQSPTAKPTQSPTTKPEQSPTAKPEQTDESSYPQKVLELVNKERKAQGLNEMVLDDSLCNAAGIRANEIITKFSHTRPDGTSCFSVLKELGISYRTTGENIASGYRTPEQVMDGWMNSEGHRANILSANFNKLGVGYVKTGSGTYWVQLFTN